MSRFPAVDSRRFKDLEGVCDFHLLMKEVGEREK